MTSVSLGKLAAHAKGVSLSLQLDDDSWLQEEPADGSGGGGRRWRRRCCVLLPAVLVAAALAAAFELRLLHRKQVSTRASAPLCAAFCVCRLLLCNISAVGLARHAQCMPWNATGTRPDCTIKWSSTIEFAP